jgi:hypothetical protein
MLYLQVDLTSNKENFLRTLDPQKKRSTPQLNRMPSTIRRSMWTNETLEAPWMLLIERDTFLKEG